VAAELKFIYGYLLREIRDPECRAMFIVLMGELDRMMERIAELEAKH
jgi:hypothetical protein